jgi:hypothetical protein
MRQSGDWKEERALDRAGLMDRLAGTIAQLDVEQARAEVARFVRDPAALNVWSRRFFREIIERIEVT